MTNDIRIFYKMMLANKFIKDNDYKILARENPYLMIIVMQNIDEYALSIAAEYLETFAQCSDEVAKYLITLTKHPSSYVREGAIYGLAHQEYFKIVDALWDIINNDPYDHVKDAAQDVLEMVNDRD